MEQHSPKSSVQPRNGGEWNTPLSRVYRAEASQDTSMDEAKTSESSSREEEGEPIPGNIVLLKGLYDHGYDKATKLARQLRRKHPESTRAFSRLVRVCIELGRVEEALHREDPEETEPESSVEGDENYDRDRLY